LVTTLYVSRTHILFALGRPASAGEGLPCIGVPTVAVLSEIVDLLPLTVVGSAVAPPAATTNATRTTNAADSLPESPMSISPINHASRLAQAEGPVIEITPRKPPGIALTHVCKVYVRLENNDQ
jgi:hypothetical protein